MDFSQNIKNWWEGVISKVPQKQVERETAIATLPKRESPKVSSVFDAIQKTTPQFYTPSQTSIESKAKQEAAITPKLTSVFEAIQRTSKPIIDYTLLYPSKVVGSIAAGEPVDIRSPQLLKASLEKAPTAFEAIRDTGIKMGLPTFLAAGLGLGVEAVIPGPGELKALMKPNVLKTLVKETDEGVLKSFLIKEVKLGEEQATTIARQVAPLKTEDEVRAVLQPKTPIPQSKKGFDWQERGFVKSVKEEFPEFRVAGQYVPRSTDRLATKARNLIKDDIKTAEKMAISGTDDDSVAVGAELLKHYSDEATKAIDETIKNSFYDKAGILANEMARKLTEQGRSVQAASILSRLTPEGQLRFAAREIQKYNEEIAATRGGLGGLKKKIPELTAEQAKTIEVEMKSIREMAEGTEKAMRFQKLQNYIADLVPTPLFKKIIAIWKAGLLTGVKTSGLNIFSNVSHLGTEILKDIPATMVDKIVSLFSGKRATAFTLKGLVRGSKEGMEKGLRYLKTGFDERNIGTKLDYKRVNFGKGKLAKGLQTYTDTVFHILGTEDQPFYYASKLRSLYEQAKVQAINKGLKGDGAQKFIDDLIQNPTEKMIKYASTDAEVAVFQNRTLLGEAAKSIQKIGGGAGEIVVPFGRTPSAVATQILNYSPVGIVKTIVENIGKGRFDQRLFAQGIGRGITGTAVMFLGGLLFEKRLINLGRPTTEKEQKLWELEGRKPNSFYDPIQKKWRSVQVLGPAGNVLLIGGYFKKEFQESGSPSEAIANALAGSTLSFTQQTYLTGVSNFIDAVSDPARSAEYVAGSTLASVIPTIVSDLARATDTKERRANEIFEKFQARIPGVRQGLEPQVDVLGGEIETIGNPLEVMADPTRPSPTKSSPVIDELRRLWDMGVKVSPTLLGDKKGYRGLTSGQNTELWKKAGEIINQKLNSLFLKDEYKKLADDKKGKVIDSVVEKSKLYARVAIVMEMTQELKGDKLKEKLSEFKESGLMTRGVYDNYLKLR